MQAALDTAQEHLDAAANRELKLQRGVNMQTEKIAALQEELDAALEQNNQNWLDHATSPNTAPADPDNQTNQEIDKLRLEVAASRTTIQELTQAKAGAEVWLEQVCCCVDLVGDRLFVLCQVRDQAIIDAKASDEKSNGALRKQLQEKNAELSSLHRESVSMQAQLRESVAAADTAECLARQLQERADECKQTEADDCVLLVPELVEQVQTLQTELREANDALQAAQANTVSAEQLQTIQEELKHTKAELVASQALQAKATSRQARSELERQALSDMHNEPEQPVATQSFEQAERQLDLSIELDQVKAELEGEKSKIELLEEEVVTAVQRGRAQAEAKANKLNLKQSTELERLKSRLAQALSEGANLLMGERALKMQFAHDQHRHLKLAQVNLVLLVGGVWLS